MKRRLTTGIGSGALLMMVPKCPACIAGYVAVVTGVSLSLGDAALLRTGIIALCAMALALAGLGLLTGCRLNRKPSSADGKSHD